MPDHSWVISTKLVQAEHRCCKVFSIGALGVVVSHLCILVIYLAASPSSKEAVGGSGLFNLMKRGITKCDLVTWFPQFSVSLCWMDLGGTRPSIC